MEYQEGWEDLFPKRYGHFLTLHHNDLEKASFEDYPPFDKTPDQTRSTPFQAGPGVGFLNLGEGLELPLEAQRVLPRYLLSMTLMTDWNVVDSGHYEYWRVTGAAASLYSDLMDSRRESLELHGDNAECSESQIAKSFGWCMKQLVYTSDLQDLMVLIQIGLLGERQRGNPPLDIDRTIHKIITHSFQIANRYGFPVLEALADRINDGNHRTFQPRIKNWFQDSPNASTRKTLLEFHRLEDVNPEYETPNHDLEDLEDLEAPLGVTEESLTEFLSRFDELTEPEEIENPEGELNPNNGLVRELKEHRNPSQHGYGDYRGETIHGVYRVPAVTVITLSCLAFWDAITVDQYQELRELLGLEGKHYPDFQKETRLMKWTPEDFYPKEVLSELDEYHPDD
ncbi:hypothetical protein [Haloarcula brevis]|uniref:hypothetical protein n=1 Tax=Haloarcula brevis TaxID=3111453 RepID=UPI00300EBE48